MCYRAFRRHTGLDLFCVFLGRGQGHIGLILSQTRRAEKLRKSETTEITKKGRISPAFWRCSSELLDIYMSNARGPVAYRAARITAGKVGSHVGSQIAGMRDVFRC